VQTTRNKNRSSNKKKIQELMSSCVRRPTDKRKRLADEEEHNYDSVAYMRHLQADNVEDIDVGLTPQNKTNRQKLN